MDDPTSSNDAMPIGEWAGVGIAVAPTDAVTAAVDLAAAGVFTHELSPDGAVGGLRHLDKAVGGAVMRLRGDGVFSAAPGEILALSTPRLPVAASTILLVGMGDPESWSPAVLETAMSAATSEALRRGAVSASFAPSLLDSGIAVVDSAGVAMAMLRGLLAALNAYPVRFDLKLWIFCTGAAHLTATHAAFARAYADLAREMPPGRAS